MMNAPRSSENRRSPVDIGQAGRRRRHEALGQMPQIVVRGWFERDAARQNGGGMAVGYRVELQHEGRLLKAKWSGQAVPHDIIDAWNRVFDRAEQVQADQILVELDYTSCLREGEAFEVTLVLVERIRQMAYPVRIARVFYDDATFSQREFTQHAASNRGVRLRTFDAGWVREAEQWLRAEPILRREVAC